VLDIGLDFGIIVFTANETLRVEDTGKELNEFSYSGIERDTYVFSGFMATWFFAASPIRRSLSEKETYEGVVRFPWSLAMISTRSFCQTPTHLKRTRKK